MKNHLPVGLSHLFHRCSVGAIVRGSHCLLTIKDIREWTNRDNSPAGRIINHVDRVRSALGIEQVLREPPQAQELDNGQIDGVCIPAVRFPRWTQCPECGLLHYDPWRKQASEKPRCQEQNPKICTKKPLLEQVSRVLVHPDGHLADVPWHSLAHENGAGQQQRQCRRDIEQPYLRFIDRGGQKQVRCSRCNAMNSILHAKRMAYANLWCQPWIKQPPDKPTKVPAEILEINDTRIHSPVTCDALVIPPESRIRKGTVLDRLYARTSIQQQIQDAKTPLARKTSIRQAARELQCSDQEIKQAIEEVEKGYPLYGKHFTKSLLLEDEYDALSKIIPNMEDDEDFVTRHHTESWQALTSELTKDSQLHTIVSAIDHLVSVNRLKAIRVYEGFQRKVASSRKVDEESDYPVIPPDIIGKSDWLPALKLYGEGIFFNFREDLLTQWEQQPALQNRSKDFLRRFAASGLTFASEINVTPRFLFLHTIAHLLIRQLEIEAGYPAASLCERLYCSEGKMSGILIYVAVPDIAGSLGGLTELAQPRRFLKLLSKVFDHAQWCSLDPVCSEHEGQGANLLNRAACHGCALIPETACLYGNVLLDRIFIKGDEVSGISPFLDYVS